MQIAINPTLYGSAQVYAEKRGLNLSVIIENFLERLISSQDATAEQDVPDVVLSLLGAGEPVAKDDINGRDAVQYYTALKAKTDVIITRNIDDFSIAKLPVMTAAEFLASIK